MSDPQALHVTRNVIPGKLGVDLHLHRVHIPLVIIIIITLKLCSPTLKAVTSVLRVICCTVFRWRCCKDRNRIRVFWFGVGSIPISNSMLRVDQVSVMHRERHGVATPVRLL